MRLALWGISNSLKGLEGKKCYIDDSRISLYIDKDDKWRGKLYKGKEVIHPDELVSRRQDYDYVRCIRMIFFLRQNNTK